MTDPFDTIRSAIADDATPEARAAGAAACRAILGALEGTVAQPPAINASAVASLAAVLRSVPSEQLLDMAIAKLRSALPPGAHVPPVSPVKFHLIPIPQQPQPTRTKP